MRLYLIRHADPDYAIDNLTPQGHKEAEALAQRLSGHGLDAIYSSNAGRALATARYTAKRLNIPVQVEPWLHEPPNLHVEQQGRKYAMWDTFGETVRAGETMPGPHDWQKRAPFDTANVMTMWRDFRAQADAFLAGHGYTRDNGRYRAGSTTDNHVAIFCHNGTVLLFLAHLLEIPLPLVWSGFFAWPASVTTFFFESHSPQWAVPRAMGVADVSHIIQAGLTPQPRAFGDWYEPFLG